eukprot:2245769-Prorocentrum_lima.AAC.1
MTSSLVGSEMCIRDRRKTVSLALINRSHFCFQQLPTVRRIVLLLDHGDCCLLYTSDAADDM